MSCKSGTSKLFSMLILDWQYTDAAISRCLHKKEMFFEILKNSVVNVINGSIYAAVISAKLAEN